MAQEFNLFIEPFDLEEVEMLLLDFLGTTRERYDGDWLYRSEHGVMYVESLHDVITDGPLQFKDYSGRICFRERNGQHEEDDMSPDPFEALLRKLNGELRRRGRQTMMTRDIYCLVDEK